MDKEYSSSLFSSSLHADRATGAGAHSLPVFVFPSSLTFYADDSASYKQILTLYNPYDFGVRFKVLSTAPQKYLVVDPEGHIKARCYVDIVIRINDVSPKHVSRSDEFRICMFQQSSGIESLIRSSTSSSSLKSAGAHVSGHRDVTATLLPDRPTAHKGSLGGKAFESIPGTSSNLTQSQIFTSGLDSPSSPPNSRQIVGLRNNNSRSPNYFLILISVAAAVVLMMPNSEAEKPPLMSFLPLPGIHMKLCAAYVLGCITKPLFWP